MLITAASMPDLAAFVAGHSAGAMAVVLKDACVYLGDREAIAAALVSRGFGRAAVDACADRAVALARGATPTACEAAGMDDERAVRR